MPCSQAELAELQAEGARTRETYRLLVSWHPECLQTLQKKVPSAIQGLCSRETVPMQLFENPNTHREGGSERHGGILKGDRASWESSVLLRGGVYMEDRVGFAELEQAAAREALEGRYLALWLFTRALGLHAKLGLSLSGCLGNCRDKLREKFQRAPPMVAAYYGTLSTDILRINKSGGQTHSDLRPSKFLSTLREVAESLSGSPNAETGALGVVLSEALACVSTVSLDRKLELQMLQPLSEVPDVAQSNPVRKNTERLAFSDQHATGDAVERNNAKDSSQPEIFRTPSGLLGDPFQMRQWYLHSFFGNFTVAAEKAWQKLEAIESLNASPVVLAVLDTGCYLHQDFIDGFDIANSIFWDNDGETDCNDGVDNDGNGYVDDCFGWNFVEDNGYPFTDDAGHGTLVTSVAAARAHDGRGGRGIHPHPKVMCLRVGSKNGVWTSATIPALDYAVKMKANVSNHSYGGPGFVAAEYEAFHRALRYEHLAVTAAGNAACDIDENESCYFTPGAFRLRGLINVMASDISGFRASFSNYGMKGVDVAAPGTLLYAGTNYRANSGSRKCTSCYTYCDGTSFAAPIVSGMAAALWHYFEAVNPPGWQHSTERPSRKVEKAIMYSVTGSKALAGALGTNGVVNMWRAMSYYDKIPGPFVPEYQMPERGYDPLYSGGDGGEGPSYGDRSIPLFVSVCLGAALVVSAYAL
ncbi:subtilase family serine [Cyclospora cayetanensis]|uniref:subtilisin n=1 Tax=Cyclospora cayetanensis TaxID=88456 RepID=A0A1D3CTV8_9EIME|nr:subtilase family serine [Cyclospora cayetanensis]